MLFYNMWDLEYDANCGNIVRLFDASMAYVILRYSIT
jgi:hypothetical protein